jgi:hypothetical protein
MMETSLDMKQSNHHHSLLLLLLLLLFLQPTTLQQQQHPQHLPHQSQELPLTPHQQ